MDTFEKSNHDLKSQSFEGLFNYLNKMKGESRSETRFDYIDSLISATGVFLAVSIIGLLAVFFRYPMAIGPLAASCVLVFIAHSGPLSQPRQVIGGHILSTATGLIIWSIFGKSLYDYHYIFSDYFNSNVTHKYESPTCSSKCPSSNQL